MTLHTDVNITAKYQWTPFVWAALVATGVTLLFFPTVQSIVRIWSESETFAHGFFVVPVFLWLIWRKWERLLTLPARPDLRPLVLIALSGFLWLLSKLAGIQVGEQFAFALILVFTLWSVLGRSIASELKFPLLFLLFLAPVGEELVPVLMENTADMTVWAIRNTGIPIYREGLFFSLPSGNWSVVEACSGIRYLIASTVLGSLFAYLSYSSLRMRLAFVAISVIVPVIANGLRAYLIVMLGHFSGNKLATGVDHLVYGWLFFGLVMFVLFSIGLWLQRFDRHATDNSTTDTDTDTDTDIRIINTEISKLPTSTGGSSSYLTAMFLIFAVVASWPGWAAAINANAATDFTAQTSFSPFPQSEPFNDQLSAQSTELLWQPRNAGHDHRVEARYENNDLPAVRAIAFLYGQQQQGKEMINSGNVLVRSEDDHWRLAHSSARDITLSSGTSVTVKESGIKAANQRMIVWQWYRIGDEVTSHPLTAKLLEVKDQLLLRNSPSVNYMLVVDATLDNHEAALTSVINKIAAHPKATR